MEDEVPSAEPEPYDPLIGVVDAVVYTLILGAPVVLMLFLGAAWVWLCVVGLVVAAWRSTVIATWLVARLRAWAGRPYR